MNTKIELNSVKKLVLRILEQYPETRNSDTKLYLKCVQELGAKTVSDAEQINLNIISVHKCRQRIQNKLGLWKATKDVENERKYRQLEFKEWMNNV